MLELVWGRGLPLPYPSPLVGQIRHVAKRIVKLDGFGKFSVLLGRLGGSARAAQFHPEARRERTFCLRVRVFDTLFA